MGVRRQTQMLFCKKFGFLTLSASGQDVGTRNVSFMRPLEHYSPPAWSEVLNQVVARWTADQLKEYALSKLVKAGKRDRMLKLGRKSVFQVE